MLERLSVLLDIVPQEKSNTRKLINGPCLSNLLTTKCFMLNVDMLGCDVTAALQTCTSNVFKLNDDDFLNIWGLSSEFSK